MVVNEDISNLTAHMEGITSPLYFIEKETCECPAGIVILPTGVMS